MSAGINKVDVFDVSVAQLEQCNNGVDKYWCDIYHEKMLKDLLEASRPTVMSLSNIPEWAKSVDDLEIMARQLTRDKKLHTIIHAGLNMPNSKFNEYLISLGWKLETIYDEENNKFNKKSYYLTRVLNDRKPMFLMDIKAKSISIKSKYEQWKQKQKDKREGF